MPTYEYRCRDCGEQLEVVQAFTDDNLTECGTCGGSLRKVFSAVGISFKGSGFYKTDSRNGSGERKADKGEKADKADKATANGDGGTKDGASPSKEKGSGDASKPATPPTKEGSSPKAAEAPKATTPAKTA